VGATWQYSISGDNGFVDGTGNSFTLADNATYAVKTRKVNGNRVITLGKF
jgi:hypothetical protein